MEEPKTPEQVKSLLERYHDIPAMIAEEEAVIRHCKEQRQVIALSGVCVNGLPNGKGQVSDPTANMAQGQDGEYEQEIKACKARISDLRLERIWVYEHMRRLSRIDERIMRLKYIGPADPLAAAGSNGPAGSRSPVCRHDAPAAAAVLAPVTLPGRAAGFAPNDGPASAHDAAFHRNHGPLDGERRQPMPTEEEKQKIRYLSRYRRINARINRLLEEQGRWREIAMRTTPSMSQAPGGGGSGSPIERPMDKVLEIDAEINREIDELQTVRQEIRAALNQLEDENLKLLMEYRYIDGLTWEQIAVKMHYGFQWVCKLHGRALNRLRIEEAIESDTQSML